MLPHADVHRGRVEHPLVGREQQRARQVVRVALRGLGHQVRRRRRHHHQFGARGELDVPHLRLVGQVEQRAVDLGARERREREGVTNCAAAAVQHRGSTRAPGLR
jgi:hypothetical protein